MNRMEKEGKNPYLPAPAVPTDRAVLAQMNPVVLAFVGDGVQTLLVRTRLSLQTDHKTGALHRMVAAEINAASQAAAAKTVMSALTEEELAVFKRCRNAKNGTVPKHASPGDYSLATGLEGLVGYLYLAGEAARLSALLEIAYPQN